MGVHCDTIVVVTRLPRAIARSVSAHSSQLTLQSLQLISFTIVTVVLRWPELYQQIARVLAVLNVDIFKVWNVSCVVDGGISLFQEFLARMIVPALIVILPLLRVLLCGTKSACRRHALRKRRILEEATRYMARRLALAKAKRKQAKAKAKMQSTARLQVGKKVPVQALKQEGARVARVPAAAAGGAKAAGAASLPSGPSTPTAGEEPLRIVKSRRPLRFAVPRAAFKLSMAARRGLEGARQPERGDDGDGDGDGDGEGYTLRRALSTIMFGLDVVFLGNIAACVQQMACEPLDGLAHDRLSADLTVECTSDRANEVVIATVFLVLYLIASPLATLLTLRPYRHLFNLEAVREEFDDLIGAYRPERWYWGVVNQLFRAAYVILPVLVNGDPVEKLGLLMLITLLYLVMVSLLKPFDSVYDGSLTVRAVHASPLPCAAHLAHLTLLPGAEPCTTSRIGLHWRSLSSGSCGGRRRHSHRPRRH